MEETRHSNLYAGPGVALCETDVEGGFADYMLFIDAKAAGVGSQSRRHVTRRRR